MDAVRIHLETHEGELAEVDLIIKKTQERIQKSKDIDAILDLLEQLQEKRNLIQESVDSLKAQIKATEDGNLSETKQLIDMLENATGDDLFDLITRVKSVIRSLISEIWILIAENDGFRECHVQVHFSGGGIRRIFMKTKRGYKITYKTKNGMVTSEKQRVIWYQADENLIPKLQHDMRDFNKYVSGEQQ